MSITGPCVVCGATDYQLSFGGPSICPACDCGIDPKLTELRVKYSEALSQLTRAEQRIAGMQTEITCLKQTAMEDEQRIAQLEGEVARLSALREKSGGVA